MHSRLLTHHRSDLFGRLERFYDAIPRDGAKAEKVGGLVLFVRNGAGWPFYARPRLDAVHPPSAADIAAVRARQRKIGAPETFEWVHESNPDLLAVARSAGLSVLEAPLMVLDPDALPAAPDLCTMPVRVLDAASPRFGSDVAAQRAVADVGFGAPGVAPGEVGPPERDAATVTLSRKEIADQQRRVDSGRSILAIAEIPGEGPVAGGAVQRAGNVAEIVGVATLPSARRRGLGTAVTATLARHALLAGADLVFLSAGSEAVARIYLRVGFRRVGTACIAEPAPVRI